MDFVYSEICLSHNPPFEVSSGRWQPHSGMFCYSVDVFTACFMPIKYLIYRFCPTVESPARLVSIHAALIKEPNVFNLIPHRDFSLAPILRVHSSDFVAYLQTAYEEWVSAGRTPIGVLPDSFPHPALVDHLSTQTWRASINSSIEAKVSTYAFDLGTMIVDGTCHILRIITSKSPVG
jgi:acetoin utilization deacetylase AcuC-like enzyme